MDVLIGRKPGLVPPDGAEFGPFVGSSTASNSPISISIVVAVVLLVVALLFTFALPLSTSIGVAAGTWADDEGREGEGADGVGEDVWGVVSVGSGEVSVDG